MLMATKKKDGEAPAAVAAGAVSIKVKAVSPGEYPCGHYRFKGDVFDYPANKKLGKWMVQVESTAKTEKPVAARPTPVALGEITAAQRAIDKKVSDLIGGVQ